MAHTIMFKICLFREATRNVPTAQTPMTSISKQFQIELVFRFRKTRQCTSKQIATKEKTHDFLSGHHTTTMRENTTPKCRTTHTRTHRYDNDEDAEDDDQKQYQNAQNSNSNKSNLLPLPGSVVVVIAHVVVLVNGVVCLLQVMSNWNVQRKLRKTLAKQNTQSQCTGNQTKRTKWTKRSEIKTRRMERRGARCNSRKRVCNFNDLSDDEPG